MVADRRNNKLGESSETLLHNSVLYTQFINIQILYLPKKSLYTRGLKGGFICFKVGKPVSGWVYNRQDL